MKLPESIDKVSVAKGMIPLGPYPPLGFVPLCEAELGNGDYYGLYWPIGKEASEPIVCDMSHDDWRLWPAFSSLDKFIEWLDVNDWDRGDEDIEDFDFAPYHYVQGKACISSNDVDGAVSNFRKACESFPEISDYWFSLSSQLRRIKKTEEATAACIEAFISNWSFGLPSEGAIRMLKSAVNLNGFHDDPLIKIISDLSMKFGGTKENHQYSLLSGCAEEYFRTGKYIKGLKLMHNYAFMMSKETSAFQERYKFNINDWQQKFSEYCLEYLGANRKWVG